MLNTEITASLQTAYLEQRSLGFRAKNAFRNAKTLIEWDAYGDNTVRLQIIADEGCDLSYLEQSEFSDVREKEYKRANESGMWGIVTEYWNGEGWEHADSVWGFIGDDWQNSGYDIDVRISALDAYKAQTFCPCCGRPKIQKDP